MKTLKRKTRSDKFPLTLHPTGQYCKKIKGKMYYFGADKKKGFESCKTTFPQKGSPLLMIQGCD